MLKLFHLLFPFTYVRMTCLSQLCKSLIEARFRHHMQKYVHSTLFYTPSLTLLSVNLSETLLHPGITLPSSRLSFVKSSRSPTTLESSATYLPKWPLAGGFRLVRLWRRFQRVDRTDFGSLLSFIWNAGGFTCCRNEKRAESSPALHWKWAKCLCYLDSATTSSTVGLRRDYLIPVMRLDPSIPCAYLESRDHELLFGRQQINRMWGCLLVWWFILQ